jgi:hypothetical protein
MIDHTPITKQPKVTSESQNLLSELLQNEREILEKSCGKIEFSQPILTIDGVGVIYSNTITTIQGQKGVHKSRLTEVIAAAFLKRNQSNDCLGFKTAPLKQFQVVYVDTERNVKDQFPYALQKIKVAAGHEKTIQMPNLRALSLIRISRQQRFDALDVYLDFITSETVDGVQSVIILDVITDCVSSFNNAEESMKLLDKINHMINDFEISFINVIHENPSSFGESKARGHLGTELINKSSQVIQIGFEKNKNGTRTDLIVIKFLHSRNTARLDPIYVFYCDKEKTLILADEEFIQTQQNLKVEKASIEELKKWLTDNLSSDISKVDLLDDLKNEFHCGSRVLEDRLKQLIKDSYLEKFKDGRDVFYRLNN